MGSVGLGWDPWGCDGICGAGTQFHGSLWVQSPQVSTPYSEFPAEHGTLILSCHVYGFYPNTITVNWMKGEEWEQYRCRVEHPGMLESILWNGDRDRVTP
uniref:Ig-like domain-containing protein n=1 Tax=Cyanistes caeruleus TaxID=156563 RepID=A0A8C0VFC6_CYACU